MGSNFSWLFPDSSYSLLDNPRPVAVEYLRSIQTLHDIEFMPEAQEMFEAALQILIEECAKEAALDYKNLETELEKKIDDLESTQEEDAEAHDREMKQLRDDHANALADLKTAHAEELARVQQQREDALAQMQRDHDADIVDLNERHKMEIIRLKVAAAPEPKVTTVEGHKVLVRFRQPLKPVTAWAKIAQTPDDHDSG